MVFPALRQAHLPTKGELAIFDRSWYNRGIVEHVMGLGTPETRAQLVRAGQSVREDAARRGHHLIKFWLNVGRATQLERFLKREKDPLKQWKLSQDRCRGPQKWDAYTSEAICETLDTAPTPPLPHGGSAGR
jgi:polyphosphate kinase